MIGREEEKEKTRAKERREAEAEIDGEGERESKTNILRGRLSKTQTMLVYVCMKKKAQREMFLNKW